MRNITPLILVLILAGMAIFLSATSSNKKAEDQAPPSASEKASEETPAEEASEPANQVKLTPVSWPFEASDIPSDPKAVYGTLENGFRYMILPNSEPPERVSIRLHIDAGSLMEAEDQRGIAHFLEHMVFNGTKRFKDANQLIREMQTRGIAFGAHVNAYTSFDETVYMLDIPDLKSDTLDLTFAIMRDFGDGALITAEEIDAERGVILSEKRSRDSVNYRIQEKQFKALFPNSLIADRFPIGTEEVIEGAPRDRFLDLYERYYIPNKMTFVVVGDIDPGEMEERIKATFGSMRNPANPGSEPNLGIITPPEGLNALVFSDSELDSTDVSLLLVRPYEDLPDTKQNRAAKLPLELANFIIGRRFERIAKTENSPIVNGDASKFTLFNAADLGSISVTAAEDRWEEATPILEQEFRRALEHGFTLAEISEAKANLINAYEEAVKRQDTRKSDALATTLASSINDKTVFTTPETSLEIATQALADITPENVHAEFTEFWEASGYHLILTTKTATDQTQEALTEIYKKSSATAIEAPIARAIQPFGYTDFGPAGQIANAIEVEELDITQLTLTNNVRVNLKSTKFEKNRIRLLASIGTGQLSQPEDMPMLDTVAAAIFNGGGLGKHSNDQLSEILAGRNVSSSLSITEDSFILSGSTTPEDLLLQLQLMVANIIDPGYRPEGLWQFQKNIPVLFQQLKHTTSGPAQEMQAWLHGNDSRYTIPDQTKLSNYSIEDVQSWLNPVLANGYIELSIVGDFDEEKLIEALLSTFGTLTDRNLNPETDTVHPRTVNFPEAPAKKTFGYESKIPQAVAAAFWKTDGMRNNIPEFRRLNVLSDIFGDRLREEIREKLGASYSPQAGASGSSALDGFAYLLGQSIGKPEDIPLLLNTMETIAGTLAEEGADKDELERAIAPTLSSLEKSLRDNSYWLSTVLNESQKDPEKLELARNRDEDYRSISLQEINALAKKYLAPSNLIQVSILPSEPE